MHCEDQCKTGLVGIPTIDAFVLYFYCGTFLKYWWKKENTLSNLHFHTENKQILKKEEDPLETIATFSCTS